MAPAKPLRPVSREELATFYTSARTICDCYEFGCHDNPRYRAIDWDMFGDAGYAQLTRAQQVLNNINLVDGQIRNGGIEQLVFNWLAEMHHLRAAVRDLGWPELAARFEAEFAAVDAGRVAELGDAFQDAARNRPWPEAAAEFGKVYTEIDGEAFNDWYYQPATEVEMVREVIRYMRRNEAELFEIR